MIVVVLVLAVAVLAAVIVKKEYKQSGEVSILYALRGEASELVNLWETDFKVSSPNAAIIGDNANAVLELINASLIKP